MIISYKQNNIFTCDFFIWSGNLVVIENASGGLID